MMRFTGRDPVRGKQANPLTLHRYLYCNNNSINMVDPDGRIAWNIFGALSAGTAVRAAATYAVASGIEYNNDRLFEIGLNMHHLIAPAMAFGAVTGPYVPKVPGAAMNAGYTLWQGATSAATQAAGYTMVAGRALSYWAMTNPWKTLNVIDAMAQFAGPPDGMPFTPSGFLAWMYVNSD